jgi:mRNA (guanine-N7-)-methyltransferase
MEEVWKREQTRKRKGGLGFEAPAAEDNPAAAAGDNPADVAAHYNKLQDRHRSLTAGSDILHLRNLNNWVKSVLLAKYIGTGYHVLDLACGKGGDMLKFKAGGCGHYVGIDIALESVRDAVRRYNGASGRQSMPFAADFCAGDFCDPSLEAALPRGLLFHLVSCQFACHYAFASEERAEALLRNVSSRLLPGGVFAGTTADACVLVRRLRAAAGLSFGNAHYSVSFPSQAKHKGFPASASPFGLAYRFSLQEAVDDCQEYLVHMPTFVAIAARHGLRLISADNFTDLFAAEAPRNRGLLERMRVLPETEVGGISEAEWEVAHSYLAFAFRKEGADAPTPPRGQRPRYRHFGEERIVRVGEGGNGGRPSPPGGARDGGGGERRQGGGGSGEGGGEEGGSEGGGEGGGGGAGGGGGGGEGGGAGRGEVGAGGEALAEYDADNPDGVRKMVTYNAFIDKDDLFD